jgi:hypothetical protein
VRITEDRESTRDLIFLLASKNSTFLKAQVEMGKMGLSLEESLATKTMSGYLEKLMVENEREKQQKQENFLRL